MGATGKHLLAAHADFFEGGAGFLAANAASDPLFEEGVGGGDGEGDPGGGRGQAGDCGHLVEDLLEGEVFSAEDVAFAGRAHRKGGDVGAGNFSDIDEVESGVHVGGEFAVQEVDEDAAGGGGFPVVGADGGSGVEDDDLQALLGGFDCLLLGEELGTLVVANHVFEGDWGVFVDDQAVSAEVHGGDRGGVDDALDAGFASHAEEFASAVDVGAVHGLRITNPEAVVGGDVHEGVAPFETGAEGLWIEEIAEVGLAANAFQVCEVAGFADE